MQLPNYHFYNGEETTIGYGLVNITEDTQVDPETNAVSGTGVISFDYKSNEEITAVRSIEKDSQDSHGYYTIDGRYAGDNFQQLPNGLYIGSGKKQMKAK